MTNSLALWHMAVTFKLIGKKLNVKVKYLEWQALHSVIPIKLLSSISKEFVSSSWSKDITEAEFKCSADPKI